MIVSLHLPKSAGSTFRTALQTYFGKNLYLDYGDWIGDENPEAIAHRANRLIELKGRLPSLLQKNACIHGHFYSQKWLSLLDSGRFFTIFRDPFEAIPSGFAFLCRNPQIPQPSVKEFHENKMTLSDYIVKWKNPNTSFVKPLGINDFEAVGIASDMAGTIKLFNATFNTDLQFPAVSQNVNPLGSAYKITPDERKLIHQYHQSDIYLWQEAKARFMQDSKKRL